MDDLPKNLLPLLPKFHIPFWLGWTIIVVLGLLGILAALSKGLKLWKEDILPKLYDAEKKRRVARRRRFASFIVHQVSQINRSDDWQDYKFAELEAEVEVDERTTSSKYTHLFRHTQNGIRRERSLSKALVSSDAQTVLLEGEPGSGKSVSLRFVTLKMAKEAEKNRSDKSVIPLYIDLKYLERKPEEQITSALIDQYVRQHLARGNDREVDTFLEDEFELGIQEQTWFFIIDSFDEIPEVLSSTDSDTFVKQYATALADFLAGMNKCRSIVGSRKFNGPEYTDWTRFRLLPLTESRRYELIKLATPSKDKAQKLFRGINSNDTTLSNFAANPLFLSLMCEYVSKNEDLPNSIQQIFDAYVERRLQRDKEKLKRRFGIEPTDLNKAAEHIAFAIAYDSSLGLSPTRDELKQTIERNDPALDVPLDACLDALEFIKIAQASTTNQSGQKVFAFIHRRFQEYFATRLVLYEPERVSRQELLTNARWRETAVATLQIQPVEMLTELIDEAENLLIGANEVLSSSWEDLLSSINDVNVISQGLFTWPRNSLHILGILQEGFSNRSNDVPDSLKFLVSRLVMTGYLKGTLLDQKQAVEVLGCASETTVLSLLTLALSGKSLWLMEAAYRQVAIFGKVPTVLLEKIREVLVRLALSGRLRQQRHTTYAYLSGIDLSSNLVDTFRLLLYTPWIETVNVLISASIILFWNWNYNVTSSQRDFFACSLLLHFLLYLYQIYLASRFGFSVRRQKLNEFLFNAGMIRMMVPLMFVLWVPKFMLWTGNAYCLYIFSVIWLPIAIFTSLKGDFVHPVWWPVLQITPILRSAISIAKKVGSGESYTISFEEVSFFKELFRDLALGVLSVMVVMGVVGLLLRVPWEHVPFSSLVGHALWHITLTILILLLGLVVISFLYWLVRGLADRERFRRWARQAKYPMSEVDLSQLFLTYQDTGVMFGIIREFRQRRLMEPTAEAKEFLLLLAQDVQLAQSEGNNDTNDSQSIQNQAESTSDEETWYQAWLKELKKKNPRTLQSLSDDCVDEFFKLIEQIQKELPQNNASATDT